MYMCKYFIQTTITMMMLTILFNFTTSFGGRHLEGQGAKNSSPLFEFYITVKFKELNKQAMFNLQMCINNNKFPLDIFLNKDL